MAPFHPEPFASRISHTLAADAVSGIARGEIQYITTKRSRTVRSGERRRYLMRDYGHCRHSGCHHTGWEESE